MINPKRKDYFDYIFSIVITSFTILLIVGQIIFIVIGLTIGIADWGLDGVLAIGLGVFGTCITVSLILTLFGAWRYWSFDSKGIANGNLFFKRRILFTEVESIEIKTITVTGKPFIITQENICFHHGKKMVTIPTYCLSKEEIEWLMKEASN